MPTVPIWVTEILAEVDRARAKFPSDDLGVTAFSEEAGEMVQAIMNHYHAPTHENFVAIRKELIQAGAMLVRLFEEGDPVHRLPPCEVPATPPDRIVVSRELLTDVEAALGHAEGLGPQGLGLLCLVQESLG